jgi:hypothetical protein
VKIAVNMTVEIDAGEWCLEYGVDREHLRDDVRTYIKSALFDMPVGAISVTMR